jgi:hypothetical protein
MPVGRARLRSRLQTRDPRTSDVTFMDSSEVGTVPDLYKAASQGRALSPGVPTATEPSHQ